MKNLWACIFSCYISTDITYSSCVLACKAWSIYYLALNRKNVLTFDPAVRAGPGGGRPVAGFGWILTRDAWSRRTWLSALVPLPGLPCFFSLQPWPYVMGSTWTLNIQRPSKRTREALGRVWSSLGDPGKSLRGSPASLNSWKKEKTVSLIDFFLFAVPQKTQEPRSYAWRASARPLSYSSSIEFSNR
jgi:hypothetical protein